VIGEQLHGDRVDDRGLQISNVLRHLDDGHAVAGLEAGVRV
jgi:hypothetical protein